MHIVQDYILSPHSYNERYSVDAPTNPDVSIDIAKLAWLSVHYHSKFAVLDEHLDVMMACDAEELIHDTYDSDSDESYVAPHSARVDEDGDIFIDDDNDDDDDTFEDLDIGVITIDHDEDIVSEHMPPSSSDSSVLDTSSSLEDMITPRLWTFLVSFGEEHVWTALTDFTCGIGAYNQSQPILQPWAAASAIEKQLSLIYDCPYSDECAISTSII
ncbi:hypothetical protein Hypma_000169 [Hypsizygus marmoreus]|uniref:Uncharacterized protein n=1 Tax=Hypsizygus marmoreus TaxID=39966 RepID=A0A369K8W1_HYPMA|nr:hypothetical protein Hypma_000169 [Hypsizygus marmoreus]